MIWISITPNPQINEKLKQIYFMYREENQKKDLKTPTSGHQPELCAIIEKLQNAVNVYEGILHQTQIKLQAIKKYEGPPALSEPEAGTQPESVTEEIDRLLLRFNKLNETAERNLWHLREIV